MLFDHRISINVPKLKTVKVVMIALYHNITHERGNNFGFVLKTHGHHVTCLMSNRGSSYQKSLISPLSLVQNEKTSYKKSWPAKLLLASVKFDV